MIENYINYIKKRMEEGASLYLKTLGNELRHIGYLASSNKLVEGNVNKTTKGGKNPFIHLYTLGVNDKYFEQTFSKLHIIFIVIKSSEHYKPMGNSADSINKENIAVLEVIRKSCKHILTFLKFGMCHVFDNKR